MLICMTSTIFLISFSSFWNLRCSCHLFHGQVPIVPKEVRLILISFFMRQCMGFNCFSFLMVIFKRNEWIKIVLLTSWLSCSLFRRVHKVIRKNSLYFLRSVYSVAFCPHPFYLELLFLLPLFFEEWGKSNSTWILLQAAFSQSRV